MKAKKIFIFGASGFVGGLLFKQFNRFYNTLGTYCTQENTYGNNRKFTSFKVAEDSAYELLESVRPSIIISVIRGPFDALITMHSHLVQYANDFDCKIVFISSANVFDAYSKYPSYEFDKTLSESVYGRFQIKIEHSLQKLPKENLLLLRAPMVFGPQSPRVKEIKQLILDKAPIEVFPNLIINVSSGEKLC
ncbi:MAG: sugar nucleotide-binding protein, partial [Flavobacteriaceae bacterium]|nr:sugar nucleotide-binding protein [Flavobacteriaceae bacterium]